MASEFDFIAEVLEQPSVMMYPVVFSEEILTLVGLPSCNVYRFGVRKFDKIIPKISIQNGQNSLQ